MEAQLAKEPAGSEQARLFSRKDQYLRQQTDNTVMY